MQCWGSRKAMAPREEAVCFGSSFRSWSQDSNPSCLSFSLLLGQRCPLGQGDARRAAAVVFLCQILYVLGKPQAKGCLPLRGVVLSEQGVQLRTNLPSGTAFLVWVEDARAVCPAAAGSLAWKGSLSFSNMGQAGEQGGLGSQAAGRGVKTEQSL